MPISISSLETVSETIRISRKNAGLTQKELAKICSLSQSTIARIENDIGSLNPSYQTIFKVVETLNNSRIFFEDASKTKKASRMMHRKIISVKPSNTISDAIEVFKHYDFPQLPVLDSDSHVVGTVYQKDLLSIAMKNPEFARKRPVSSIMRGSLPQIDRDTELLTLRPILEDTGAVIVVENGKAIGIITIYDVLKEA